MRIESSVTAVSWIPSEAVSGLARLPFDVEVSRYDEPPPDHIDDLADLQREGRFRVANELRAWIEVEDGRVVRYGQGGHGWICPTDLRIGRRTAAFAAVAFPDLRPDPVEGDGWVRFAQTAGGRTGVPAPRRVSHPPFVQLVAPRAWSTLELTLHADGRTEGRLAGASPFPRHWVYDGHGDLVAKSGMVDFDEWWRNAFGRHTPWGDEDSPALVTTVETALERALSAEIMRGGEKPELRRVPVEATLTEQGEAGDELFLLLDGVLRVEVDGAPVAEVGPGAVLGERSLLEGGRRTSTLRAVTPVKVAVARADQIDRGALVEVSRHHRREGG